MNVTGQRKKVRMSELAVKWLRLDGKPFSFARYPMHQAFYDGRFPRMLFKTSRQIGKSVTLANLSILESCAIPHWSTMFVAPSKEHTTRFSNTRLSKIMKYSPMIRRNFLQTDQTDRILQKQYTNGAEMLLTYASDEAERLRGPSTNRNMFDEVQDMLYDPVIIVGNETLSNQDLRFETYAGTPLTTENTIQYLWDGSTQNEWVMQCAGCKALQYFVNDKCLGLKGPICLKCGKLINPYDGRWVQLKPPKEENHEFFHTALHGFHVNQLIMPANVPIAMERLGAEAAELAQRRWDIILVKHRDFPPSKFNNEVIGVSDTIGTRMLSLEELQACCDSNRSFTETPLPQDAPLTLKTAGVDWSGGGTSGISRTVLWIWGFDPRKQKLVCLFYKVFPGRNPVAIVGEIARICLTYQVAMTIGDAGEGHLANNLLMIQLGGHHRLQQLQYGSQKKAITWNGVDRYTVDRTMLIDNYFMLLKRGGAEFAHQDQMYTAFEDILNEYEEVTVSGKKVWRHSPQKPDDCLHAGLFGWVAYKITQGDLSFYQ